MNAMRYITYLLNFIVLGAVAFLFATQGAPRNDELWIVILMTLAPFFSIITLFCSQKEGKVSQKEGKVSWLTLYIRRKRLEEISKIEQLGQ